MATISWKFGIPGDWSTAADWSTGTIPGSADEVTINASGTYTVTVATTAEAAHSLTLNAAGATLAITEALTVATTLDATAGTLSLGSDGSLNGGTVIAGGAAIVFAGGTLSGLTWEGALDLSGTGAALHVTNNGTNGVTLTGAGGSGAGAISLTGTNDSLSVSGNVAGVGAISLTGTNDSMTIAGTLNDTGAVTLGAGTSFVESSGKLTIGAASTDAGDFEVQNSSVANVSGNFTNSGTFGLHDDTAVTISDGFTNSGALYLDTTYTTYAGQLSYTEGGSSLTIGGTLNNTGVVQIGSYAVLFGNYDYTLNAATTITLGALVNSGTADSFSVYGSASHAATLAFSSGGTGFTSNGGNFDLTYAAALTLKSGFTNSGTFGLHDDTAVTISDGFTNSGALYLDTTYTTYAGQLSYTEGGSSLTIGGTLNNTGVVQIGNYAVLFGNYDYTLNAATTITLGALVNSGTADSFSVYGSASHAATLAFSSGGTGFTSNGGNFDLTYAAALTLKSGFTNSGTFGLHDDTAVTISDGFTNSGALYLDTTYTTYAGQLSYTEGGSSLTIGGTLNNTGVVQIGNYAVLFGNYDYTLNAATTITLGALVNSGTADSFSVYGSASHAATLAFSSGGTGFTSNGGNFDLTYAAALTLKSGFTNSGTFGLHDDTAVTISDGFTNSGALYLDTTYTTYAGQLSYTEGGSSLTIGGTLNNTGVVQIGNYAVLFGNYDYTLNAATTITLGGFINASGGSFTMYGSSSHAATLTVSGPAANAGALDIGSYAVLEVTGGNAFTQTAGTTTVYGTFTAATIDIDGGVLAIDTTNFTNTGILAAADGGLIDFSGGGLTNLSGGTLTGGTYEVDAGSTIRFASGVTIATDNADIVLRGAGSVIESGTTSIGAQLTSIGQAGSLHLLSGASFTTVTGFVDNGLLDLGAGTFTAGGLAISTTGTLHGFGTVAALIDNQGTIDAANGRLVLTEDLSDTGAVLIDAGATLELGSTAQSAVTVTFDGFKSDLVLDTPSGFAGTLAGFSPGDTIELVGVTGTTATINSGTLTVNLSGGGAEHYAVSGSFSGERAAVSLDGTGDTFVVLYRYAAASSHAPEPVTIGNEHVGGTLSQALTITNTASADGYSEDLDANMSGATAGVVVSGTIHLLPPGATNSTGLQVGVNTTSAGAKSGTATIDLFTDGTGVDGFGPLPLPSQTVHVSGAVYRLAMASAHAPEPVTIANEHVGGTLSQALTIGNTATADGFSENLDASISGATTGITASGSFSELAPGTSDSTHLTVGLNTSTAGAKSGTATITLVSDGSTIDGLGTTDIGTQTVHVSGAVYRLAAASGHTPEPVNLGNHHVGDVVSQTLTIGNTATADGFSENLDASIGDATAGIAAKGSFTELAPGATDSTHLTVWLGTAVAGLKSGTATITLVSDGSTIDGLGTTDIGTQTVDVSGAVYRLATASAHAPEPVTIANEHVGGTLGQALTIGNTATADGFSENLDASIAGATAGITASGSFTELAPGTSDSTHLTVGLNTSTAGAKSGTATITLISDGSTIDGLGTTDIGTQTVHVSGAVYRLATASAHTPEPVTIANEHVGGTLSQALTIGNTATADGFSENLDASISGATTGITASGSFSELAPGTSDSTHLTVGLNTSTAGAKSGTATITLVSDGSTIDGLGTTDIGTQTVHVSGAVYRLAAASGHTPEPVNLGNHHVGDVVSQTLTIGNTATADGFSENLDASIGGATAGIAAKGSFTELAPGATDSTHLTVWLGTAVAGLKSGTATITLVSDGSTIDGLGTTDIGTQTVDVSGAVYRLATASAHAPEPVTIANEHVGGTLGQALTIGNTATADGFSENLDASIAGATAGITASGSFTELAPGTSDSTHLTVGLNTSTAGAKSGTATITLISDGSTIDGLGTTDIGTQTVHVSGAVYRLASASAHTPEPVSFGTVHVGDTVDLALSITNTATADGFSENLDGNIGGATAGITASGSFSELTAGATDSTHLTVGLNTSTAGAKSGTATITLVSDGSTIDNLGTTALGSQTVHVSGTVDNYATADIQALSGQTITGSATAEIINLGTLLQNSGSVALTLDVQNSATGQADQLAGSFVVPGATGFTDTGFASFSGLGDGQVTGADTVTLSTANTGTFSETITLDPKSTNVSSSTTLAAETLTITGIVQSGTVSLASASPHAPEPANLGNYHVGAAVNRALSITNTAPVGSENLDASIGGATVGIIASGSFTELAPGATDSTHLTVGLNTSTAGAKSGTATITLVSDGSTIDGLGTTDIGTQTVDVSGAVYRLATASAHAPEPVTIANEHVGSTLGQALTIGNTATTDGFSENLDASIAGATAGITASGSFTELAPGTSDSTHLTVGLNTSTAGAKSGTATITLISDGSTIDGLGTTDIGTQTVHVSGAVYRLATASAHTPEPVSFGTVHVGDTVDLALSITNTATADGFSENLDGNIGGATAGITASGSFSELTAGATDSTHLTVGLNTSTAGAKSGTATITLVSDGSTIDNLGTTALGSQTVHVSGTVDNYATADIQALSGQTITGSATAEIINLGTLLQNSGSVALTLDVQNSATGQADQLAGSFVVPGATGFTDTGFASFSGLGDGQVTGADTVTLSTANTGTFSETITLDPKSTNVSSSTTLAAETLTINGLVTPEYTLTPAPTTIEPTQGLDTFIATGGALNSQDSLTGGPGGENTLDLTGAGVFDLGAPGTLAAIQLVNTSEGQAAFVNGGTTIASTAQVVFLRNELTVTLDVASPAPNAANPNPRGISIYGANDSSTINLGTGADTVVLGSSTETVNGGGGTALIKATAAFAGAAVKGTAVGQTTLEITNAGTVTLNAGDTHAIIKLDAASHLTLNGMGFITAVGQVAGNTITAAASNQTLGGLAGGDSLLGFSGFGDTFLGSSAGLNGDTIGGFGGAGALADKIDLTDLAPTASLGYAGNTTQGVLTLNDGTHHASITMLGDFSQSGFHVATDGHAGSFITYT